MTVTEQEMVEWVKTIEEIQAEMDQHPTLDKGNFPGLDVTLRLIEDLRAERAEPRVTVKFEDDTAELLCEALRDENHRLTVDRDISVQLGTGYRDEVDRLRDLLCQATHGLRGSVNDQLNLAIKQRDELNTALTQANIKLAEMVDLHNGEQDRADALADERDEALGDSAADTASLEETREHLVACRREKGELRGEAVDLIKKLRYQLATGTALFRRKKHNDEEKRWLDTETPGLCLDAKAFMDKNP